MTRPYQSINARVHRPKCEYIGIPYQPILHRLAYKFGFVAVSIKSSSLLNRVENQELDLRHERSNDKTATSKHDQGGRGEGWKCIWRTLPFTYSIYFYAVYFTQPAIMLSEFIAASLPMLVTLMSNISAGKMQKFRPFLHFFLTAPSSRSCTKNARRGLGSYERTRQFLNCSYFTFVEILSKLIYRC